MPELPEVETIRRDLEKKIINKKIVLIKVGKPKIIRETVSGFKKILLGNSFVSISCIGKLLIFRLKKENKWLLIHLKMTGQLIYIKNKKITAGGHSWPSQDLNLPGAYTHVTFEFFDHSKLFFNDLRQFGYLRLVNSKQKDDITASYGIEPLTKNFTFTNWQKILQGKTTNVKAVLLNQKLIAGIGNIYSNEICWQAKVSPQRPVNKLSKQETRKIFNATQSIIKKAIQYRGTTFNNYLDASGRQGNFTKFLKVYGRAGEKCLRCNRAVIKKIKLNGRGTSYCPQCQK